MATVHAVSAWLQPAVSSATGSGLQNCMSIVGAMQECLPTVSVVVSSQCTADFTAARLVIPTASLRLCNVHINVTLLSMDFDKIWLFSH